MTNIKHKYIQNYGQDYCCRCNTRFDDLYRSAKDIDSIDLIETFGDFVNRVNPCLSDEELAIKNILE